jgi:hypothetical protein
MAKKLHVIGYVTCMEGTKKCFLCQFNIRHIIWQKKDQKSDWQMSLDGKKKKNVTPNLLLVCDMHGGQIKKFVATFNGQHIMCKKKQKFEISTNHACKS